MAHIVMLSSHFSKLHSSNELDLCRGLTRLGYKVTLVTSSKPSRLSKIVNKKMSATIDYADGFKFIRLPTPFELRSTPILLGLKTVLKNLKPDLIHSQDYFRYHSIVGFKLSQRLKIPFIFTQHRYFKPRGINGIAFLVGNITIWKTIVTNADGITAISNQAKDFLLSCFQMNSKINVIPHSVDTNKFKPFKGFNWFESKLGLSTKPIILCVSRLEHIKGLHFLITSMSYILRKHPEVKLVIIGSGKEKKVLESLIKKKDLQNSIFLVSEYVDYHNEMPKVYSSADLFVLPTLQDVLPISILEAMASGLPIISTHVGGIRDVVRDDFNGYLINPADTSALIECISYLLDNLKILNKFRKNSRYLAQKVFDMMVIAKKTAKVYEESL